MTRTLFFLTCLAGVAFAVTAFVIRFELATPGVSALFTGADGAPDARKFNETAFIHSLFAYLSVILLGTTMCAAARDKGAMFAGIFMGLGMAVAAVVFVSIVLAVWPRDPTVLGEGVG